MHDNCGGAPVPHLPEPVPQAHKVIAYCDVQIHLGTPKTVRVCRLSPIRAHYSSLTLGLSVQAAYIDRAHRKRFSSKTAGHTSILWITGRVKVAMGV